MLRNRPHSRHPGGGAAAAGGMPDLPGMDGMGLAGPRPMGSSATRKSGSKRKQQKQKDKQKRKNRKKR